MSAGFKAWTGLLAFLPSALFRVGLFGPINYSWIASTLAMVMMVGAIIVFWLLIKKLVLVPPDKQGLWIALLVFGNWVLVSFFWYKHIYSPSKG